ncbi:MAG: DegV family protein [Erysipelotrichaceae bacterium]|nr:DegV family protein [Erysipelotrichaceae bacterium]
MKVGLLMDSSCDISEEEVDKYQLEMLRFPLIIDGKEYQEEHDISLKDFAKKMREGSQVHTAQNSVGVLSAKFDELLTRYDQILYLPISRHLSGAYETGLKLAKSEAYANRVFVADTRGVCFTYTLIALQVKQWLKQGISLAEIVTFLDENDLQRITLIPEDLQYLKRGGRISAGAAALASLLKIYPVLGAIEGEVLAIDKVRTLKKAHQMMIDYFADYNFADYYWVMLSADNDEAALPLYQELRKMTGQPVLFHQVYPIVMTHCGPGTVGIGCVKRFAQLNFLQKDGFFEIMMT